MKPIVWIALLEVLAAGPPAAGEHLRLGLAEALDRARAASPRLRELASLAAAAAADERRARSARRPDVDAVASYGRLSDVPELSVPQGAGGSLTLFPNIPDRYAARVALAVPLYSGGRLRSAAFAAGLERDAAESDVRAGGSDLVLEVSSAYWSLALAGERRRVVSEALASFEAHLGDVQNRRRFGLAAANDELAVLVERDRAELERLEADRAYALAEADLERLLDLPSETAIEAIDPLAGIVRPAEDLEALVTEALVARPERAAGAARAAAAEAAAAVARGARKPQVRGSAGYDLARPNTRILPLTDELDDSWEVSMSVVYNLFDGGKRRAAAGGAEARADAARERLEALDRAIRMEVTARRLELVIAGSAIAVAEAAVRSAVENVRVTGERFRHGLVPSSELLDAETARLRAGLELAAAQARLHLAAAALERAVGRR